MPRSKVSKEEKPKIRDAEKGKTFLEMRGITKRFPGVVANDKIDFDIKVGEIHAILGENGAGKTTLMNILYGLYAPDEGDIYFCGRKVTINSPTDSIKLGIGMVHQHFMLVPTMTVTQNIILGYEPTIRGLLLDTKRAGQRITNLSEEYGLKIDPDARISELSVGEWQRVEILKALFREARLIIMDEPTSSLTPQETKNLLMILKRMAKKGLAIIPFITHKLPEVLSISDRVTVLRNGKVVSVVDPKNTDEKNLVRKMIGREVIFRIKRPRLKVGEPMLKVKDLVALDDKGLPALKKISFVIKKGEILGIAGVSGNGQKELAEVIAGLRKAKGGKVFLREHDVTNCTPGKMIEAGLGFVPAEKVEMGIIADFTIAENLILKSHDNTPFAYNWFLPFEGKYFINKTEIREYARKLMSDFDIIAPNEETPAGNLSGGNIQRLILARELSRNPKLFIATQPTRGLDVGATEFIRKKLMEQRGKGMAILLISEDLDEIMSMSDRIAVMYEGKIVGVVPAAEAKIKEIGLMMAGAKR